jgi:hypothetical protein
VDGLRRTCATLSVQRALGDLSLLLRHLLEVVIIMKLPPYDRRVTGRFFVHILMLSATAKGRYLSGMSSSICFYISLLRRLPRTKEYSIHHSDKHGNFLRYSRPQRVPDDNKTPRFGGRKRIAYFISKLRWRLADM